MTEFSYFFVGNILHDIDYENESMKMMCYVLQQLKFART